MVVCGILLAFNVYYSGKNREVLRKQQQEAAEKLAEQQPEDPGQDSPPEPGEDPPGEEGTTPSPERVEPVEVESLIELSTPKTSFTFMPVTHMMISMRWLPESLICPPQESAFF